MIGVKKTFSEVISVTEKQLTDINCMFILCLNKGEEVYIMADVEAVLGIKNGAIIWEFACRPMWRKPRICIQIRWYGFP